MGKGHKHASIPQILLIGRLLEERLVKDETGQVRVVDGSVEYQAGQDDELLASIAGVSKASVAGIRQKTYGRLTVAKVLAPIDCGHELRIAKIEKLLVEQQQEIRELVAALNMSEERLRRIENPQLFRVA